LHRLVRSLSCTRGSPAVPQLLKAARCVRAALAARAASMRWPTDGALQPCRNRCSPGPSSPGQTVEISTSNSLLVYLDLPGSSALAGILRNGDLEHASVEVGLNTVGIRILGQGETPRKLPVADLSSMERLALLLRLRPTLPRDAERATLQGDPHVL